VVGDVDVRRDDLEGDGPVEDGVVRLEHRPHAPTANPLDHTILAERLDHVVDVDVMRDRTACATSVSPNVRDRPAMPLPSDSAAVAQENNADIPPAGSPSPALRRGRLAGLAKILDHPALPLTPEHGDEARLVGDALPVMQDRGVLRPSGPLAFR